MHTQKLNSCQENITDNSETQQPGWILFLLFSENIFSLLQHALQMQFSCHPF